MTYKELEKLGIKVHEDDFYDGNVYLFTVSYWVYEGILYRHEEHQNQLRYTGENQTAKCSKGEAEFYLKEFPEEDVKKYFDAIEESANEIKKNRLSAGFTQEEFSILFEIPLNTIKKWDSGISSPPDWAKKLIIEKLKRLKN